MNEIKLKKRRMNEIKLKKNFKKSLTKLVAKILIIELLFFKNQLVKTEKFLFEQFLKCGSHVSYTLAIQVHSLRIAQIKILKKLQQYKNYIKNSIISIKEIWRRILANKKRIFAIILLSLFTLPKSGIGDAGYWSIEITEKPRPILLGKLSGKRTRPILMSWKFWNWKQERKLKKKRELQTLIKEGKHRLLFDTRMRIVRENRKKQEELQAQKDQEEVARMHAFPREIEPGPYTIARARVISLYLNSKYKKTYSIVEARNVIRLMFLANDQKDAKEKTVFLLNWSFRGYKIWFNQKILITDSPYPLALYPRPFPSDLRLHIIEMARIIENQKRLKDLDLADHHRFDYLAKANHPGSKDLG